jgi:hypothetical protein
MRIFFSFPDFIHNHPFLILALFSIGRIVCFGDNSNGYLGVNSFQTMIALGGITSLGFITFSDTIPAILMSQSGTSSSTCALFVNGRVRCWGTNVNQQLGDASIQARGTNTALNSVTTATFVSFKASINTIPITSVDLGTYSLTFFKEIYIYICIYMETSSF